MGAHLSGGVALKWLMNNILEMGSYDEMTSLAATVPAGSEGLGIPSVSEWRENAI